MGTQGIIVYGSQYGTARRYADELSRRTGMQAVSYEGVDGLSSYGLVVFVGGLYAGGVMGLSETMKRFPLRPDQAMILGTVGLADPSDPSNIDSIRQSIRKQVPEALYGRIRIFHLRGGIDYRKLTFRHRTMMTLLYGKVRNLPPERRNAETEAFVDTYGKDVDFVDLSSLAGIQDEIGRLGMQEEGAS